MLKSTSFLSFVLVLLISCQGQSQNHGSIAKNIEAKEFNALIQQLDNEQLLDVRTPEEVSNGYIKGALNIDFYDDEFKNRLEVLDINKPVLVYCAAGGRSGNAMSIMKQKGFKEVYNLKGGFGAWEDAKLEYVK